MAELLADLFIPQVNCLPVKRPFGALKELLLPVIHEEMGAPYSSTSAWWLLRRVGEHKTLQEGERELDGQACSQNLKSRTRNYCISGIGGRFS